MLIQSPDRKFRGLATVFLLVFGHVLGQYHVFLNQECYPWFLLSYVTQSYLGVEINEELLDLRFYPHQFHLWNWEMTTGSIYERGFSRALYLQFVGRTIDSCLTAHDTRDLRNGARKALVPWWILLWQGLVCHERRSCAFGIHHLDAS